MEQEITQEDISPEEAKASLGFSTTLVEQMLAQMNPQMAEEATQESEAPTEVMPEEEEEPIEDIDVKLVEMEDRLTSKIDSLSKDMKTDDSKELENIKKQLEDILNEEDD